MRAGPDGVGVQVAVGEMMVIKMYINVEVVKVARKDQEEVRLKW